MSNEAIMAENKIKPFSTMQLLMFCLGFFGLQFAWQMRLALSGPVTEGLGAYNIGSIRKDKHRIIVFYYGICKTGIRIIIF